MNTPKHTAGLYKQIPTGHNEKPTLHKLGQQFGLYDDQEKAIAYAPLTVFAAAPELLAALQGLIELYMVGRTHKPDAVITAEAALNKAKGGV